MRLTDHFSLEELTESQTAARLGLNNAPNAEMVARLIETAKHMEGVRAVLAKPVLVSSGYRSLEVNRAIGSVDASAHVKGYAVDFICPGFGNPKEVCEAIVAAGIEFDQLILEFDAWVHISFDPRMRGEVKTKRSKAAPYQLGLH